MSIGHSWARKLNRTGSLIEYPCDRGDIGRDRGVYVMSGESNNSRLSREDCGRSEIVCDSVR